MSKDASRTHARGLTAECCVCVRVCRGQGRTRLRKPPAASRFDPPAFPGISLEGEELWCGSHAATLHVGAFAPLCGCVCVCIS